MLGLPGIFTYQKSASGTPSQLIFSMEDLPGKYLVGFMLQPTNPRHSLNAQLKVGGSVVFESYHQSRAVWDIIQWRWVDLAGMSAYGFQQNTSPSIPNGGRSYTNVLPDYWAAYYLPQSQSNKAYGSFETGLTSNPPASTTPRNPSYVYSAPHWPVWFVADRSQGQEIRIDVQASMEVPPSSGDLNDDYPVAETNQTFAGVIVGWLMRI
jgi:hypothetical protein